MSLVLVQFVFRVTMGMAAAMALTPASLVTSGYFRIHLWVLMGLNTFAALALTSIETEDGGLRMGVAIALAVASYVGAVCWLYERRREGKAALLAIALAAGLGALCSAEPRRLAAAPERPSPAAAAAETLTSGMLLGATAAAMFLGHWYLNTPTMQLRPLQRLIQWAGVSVAARALAAGAGLAALSLSGDAGSLEFLMWCFLGFRWLAGLAGVGGLIWLTWLTLKVPNTQSATGILYAAVVLTILGELVSQLLSSDTGFAL